MHVVHGTGRLRSAAIPFHPLRWPRGDSLPPIPGRAVPRWDAIGDMMTLAGASCTLHLLQESPPDEITMAARRGSFAPSRLACQKAGWAPRW